MLRATGITKSFPGVKALEDVDFEVYSGEIHALVGENGAGKSTLVKILGGALRPDAGTASLAGQPLPFGDPVRTRALGVGIIYQELALVPELSAAENIFLGREWSRTGMLSRSRMAESVADLLTNLGCRCDAHTPVRKLGVGTQQLVEVARAVGSDSRLLVFDEPSATLTDQELARLFETIRQLRADGLGIVYISHRLEEVFALADRVTVLRDGRAVATAPVDQVQRPRLIRWMVGRDLADEYPERRCIPQDVVLEVRNLSRPPLFRDVSFTVRSGEILGLAGLVGAGRTSAALAVFGALRPAHGEVILQGRPVHFAAPDEALASGVGYLTEDRKGRGIFESLSVAENVTISNLPDFCRGGLLSESDREEVAKDACGRFDVRTTSVSRPMRTLSGGNQQKALLARLLLRPMKVLILDEPTRGVDVAARAEVYDLINSLVADGVAVVMISSELPELLGMCDRIAVMREGVTVGTLERGEATQERIMDLATAGGSE
ncbi:MAG: sugar ABC transporter ATP-binding protein [Planctomycetota bacterium]|jgi:ABC-type sugar transport system ATPase subunit